MSRRLISLYHMISSYLDPLYLVLAYRVSSRLVYLILPYPILSYRMLPHTTSLYMFMSQLTLSLLPTTYYRPPMTHHLLLATYYLLLKTYYLLLANYYLLLTAYYVLLTA